MDSMRIAFGPEAPAFGSWEWLGADLCQELRNHGCGTSTFHDSVPACDVAVFVKFKPPAEMLRELRRRCRLVYCPVDLYGSAAEIDADAPALSGFDRIIVHCERLRKYFAPYSRVDYLDHHLKFIAEPLPVRPPDGPLLWIGNRSNLPPVVDWVNRRMLPGDLWILTDFPSETEILPAARLGFQNPASIRVGRWTPARHVEWTSLASAALDVKGDDFRARHKPPTKALDFLASGVPMAMNADSSSNEHLQQMYGFSIAPLDDCERWLSQPYWEDVQHLATRLRADLSLPTIAQRFLAVTSKLHEPSPKL